MTIFFVGCDAVYFVNVCTDVSEEMIFPFLMLEVCR
jgi:hypothetical protein